MTAHCTTVQLGNVWCGPVGEAVGAAVNVPGAQPLRNSQQRIAQDKQRWVLSTQPLLDRQVTGLDGAAAATC